MEERKTIWHDASEKPQKNDCILARINHYCEKYDEDKEWVYDVADLE